MALRLYAATTSKGKLRDFRTAAQAHSIDIEPLPNLEAIPAPEEDGPTFAANATLKAVYYSRLVPGELVLADDSGLEVDALDAAPGVRSARFAADSGLIDSPDANDNTDVWNNIVLLQRLAGIIPAQRTAHYRCVLVAARDSTPPRAQSKASSLKPPEAPAASATTRSSTCPPLTAPWPNSTSKPSSLSAIEAAPSPHFSPCSRPETLLIASPNTSIRCRQIWVLL
jgi:non-canonical purine NTP pyrophosphatase (RdgB/HAM1 family)